MELQVTSGESFNADIYIAGDLVTIKHVCREYVNSGFCVSVTPIDYIFTGGCESGAKIGFINYQRFPLPSSKITEKAIELAKMLIEKCFQLSASVVTSNETYFISDGRKR